MGYLMAASESTHKKKLKTEKKNNVDAIKKIRPFEIGISVFWLRNVCYF